MKIKLVLSPSQRDLIHTDLSRPHPHAAERVGFLSFRPVWARQSLELIPVTWHPVADHDYLHRENVGACIGPGAFRHILEHVYFNNVGILHIHRHDHWGSPCFSSIDRCSMQSFIPTFFNARASVPHGAVVLSFDQGCGIVRTAADGPDLLLTNLALHPTP